MAAATDIQTVSITINDIEISVPKGELIVEAVKRLGLEIPIFCYHPRMKPVGMCRMCIVEVGFKQPDGSVRKMPKPQAACTLPASDGMVIFTDSEVVHRDRKGVLEFLLVNHPLDCPICDRGGECPLQNNTLFYGPSTSRFTEMKRHAPKAFPLSQYVTLDLERCIQCGRCVRFTEEISGDSQLAFRFRGARMQPSTFELRDFTSKFSGNVIEICPVGALTSSKYRFRARPWDLQTKPAVCTLCSNGCNVWFDYRVDRAVRINGRSNEAVNEEWTCDRGKFGHDFYNEERLTQPMIRRGDRLEPCSWSEAYAEIQRAFSAGGNKVAALAGPSLSNEDLFALQTVFRRDFQSNNLDYRSTAQLFSQGAMPAQRVSIASLETSKSILLFGGAMEVEQPMVYLRARKAWSQHGAKVIAAHWDPTDADQFADQVLRYQVGSGHVLAGFFAGSVDIKTASEKTGIKDADLRQAVDTLSANNASIVASQGIYDAPDGLQIAEALTKLGAKLGGCSIFAEGANHQGAAELGFLPDVLPARRALSDSGKDDFKNPKTAGLGTHGIFHGCLNGSVEALWLAGFDPFEVFAKGDAEKVLESVGFLVVQAATANHATGYASVVLPMTGPVEADGTYTNCEGRVQRIRRILPVRGDAKSVWQSCTELAMRLSNGKVPPYFNAGDILKEIKAVHPGFSKVTEEALDGEGAILG